MCQNDSITAEKYVPKIIEIRRQLHSHPELSNAERDTSAFIADALERLGLEVRKNVGGGYGISATLYGSVSNGKTVGLRADMDALPICEKTGLDFASRFPNAMHACGHDMHMAILLGAAMVLTDMRDDLKGNVKFIFQPAEEDLNRGGALAMIEDGVLQNPKVDAVLGLHVCPKYHSGTINCRPGSFMAAVDRMKITIIGEKTYGLPTHLSPDSILIAAQFICAIQSIVARNVAPEDAAEVTIGAIQGMVMEDAIRVDMKGAIRTFNSSTRELIAIRVETLLNSITTSMGGTCALDWFKGYPPLINDAAIVAALCDTVTEELGTRRYNEVTSLGMGGEDFAYFAQNIPAAMFLLGCTPYDNDVSEAPKLHSAYFSPDENCILPGVQTLAATTLSLLANA